MYCRCLLCHLAVHQGEIKQQLQISQTKTDHNFCESAKCRSSTTLGGGKATFICYCVEEVVVAACNEVGADQTRGQLEQALFRGHGPDQKQISRLLISGVARHGHSPHAPRRHLTLEIRCGGVSPPCVYLAYFNSFILAVDLALFHRPAH